MTTLHELCQTIAETLGPDWSSITPPGNQNRCSNLIHTNGMSLFCERQRGERLGIEVDAIESITEEGRIIFRYNRDRPSITVSATRDATAIARDIHSRLLPKATAWWEEGMKGKVKNRARTRQQAATSKATTPASRRNPGLRTV